MRLVPAVALLLTVTAAADELNLPIAAQGKRRSVRSGPLRQMHTVVLAPSKDNTLYETGDGGMSNGTGPHLFTGTTQSLSRRRALIAFDVAGQLPPGSRIVKVVLTMRVSMTISGAEPVTLHRVRTDWGEGLSNAGGFRDGAGGPALTGDATWLHTFFPDRHWSVAGGDFDETPDATTPVARDTARWESAAMVARVQQWLDQPSTNFGWIIVGNESRTGTAKRLDGREVQPDTTRPSLTIEFLR